MGGTCAPKLDTISAQRQRPNTVLMYADEMGYGDFGAHNDGYVQTPNLDALIGESHCLSQHYPGSPVRSPARAALVTGRYSHRTGAVTPQEVRSMDRIATREATIGDTCKAGGYATGMAGKWHNGALDARCHPNPRGFDEFVGFRGGWADYYRWNLDVNGLTRPSDGRYLTDVLSEEAVSFIGRHAFDPFLLMVPFNAPHSPLQAPDVIVEKYIGMDLSRDVALTYAMIEVMDQAAGRILTELEYQGLDENTIVMFTSDNGPAFMLRSDQVPSGVNIDTTRYNWGFNGAKGSVYEGGIRVAMIMRWTNGLPSGHHEVTNLIHFTDWLPTLAAAAGIDMQGDLPLDRNNVLPQILGEQPWDEPRRFWQWNETNPSEPPTPPCERATGSWCGLVWTSSTPAPTTKRPTNSTSRRTSNKYNPQNVTSVMQNLDPQRLIPDPPAPELNNLIGSHPGRAGRMLRELESWFEEVNAERATAHLETLS